MVKRFFCFIPLLFLILPLLYSQYAPDTGWKQIETENFLIIFPEEMSSQAMDIAGKIEGIYRMESLGFDPVRQSLWPIVLTSSDMEYNGFVFIPPRKSVWSGTPVAEDLPPMGWLDLLAVHEVRHMVQYDTLMRRLNRVLYLLGGESGLSVGLYWGIPGWYLEGDAVGAETAFSESGRGRDPLFYQHIREIILEEDFSYQKMVNRSYKDYVPNEYELGYFLTSYIKREYGEDSWNRILDSAALLPFPAYGLYRGARKVSGLSWSKLYDNMAEDLKGRWREQAEKAVLIENRKITGAAEKGFTLWEPLSFRDGRIVARKTTLADTASLVEIGPEGEKRLCRVPSTGSVTVHGDKAVWTWKHPSLLYESLSWSDLIRIDLNTGRKISLTEKSRYLTPSYSHGGSELAAVEWSIEQQSILLVLDDRDGSVLERYALPDSLFAAYPAWSDDDKTLYFTVQGSEGRAIASLDRETGSYTRLTAFSAETVKRLNCDGTILYYSSNYSGFENIMALDTENGKRYQVSSRLKGVRNPHAGIFEGKKVLLYSEYSSVRGEQLALQDLRPDLWREAGTIETGPFLYYPAAPEPPLHPAEEPRSSLHIEDYPLGAARFNIHSWGLAPGGESGTDLQLYIRSDDVMNTFGWTLGGALDVNEMAPGAFFTLNWQQFYPVISIAGEYWQRNLDGTDFHDISSALRLSFPLNLDRDLWYHRVEPYAGAGADSIIVAADPSIREDSTPLHYGLTWYSLLPGSSRSLNPLWGCALTSYYKHTPLQEDNSYLFSSRAAVYLPGGIRNTSLSLTGGYESQSGNYRSRLLFSRGYEAEEGDSLVQLAGNYDFPLGYPDLALGSFVYLKRITGKCFYDYTGLSGDESVRGSYRSVGAEINLELIPFNASQFPLSLGLRYSWLIDREEPVFQLVFMTLGI